MSDLSVSRHDPGIAGRTTDLAGDIASAIAREFRNPLFSISSAAQLLRLRAGEDPVIEKHAGRILRDVERLNRVVAALLDYGQPRELALEPTDPDRLWDAVLEQQAGALERRALAVERRRGKSAARCAVDRDQMQQVFADLLVSACEDAAEGSSLALSSSTDPSGDWHMTLTYHGEPVSLEVAAHVFDLLTASRPLGTGANLALCRRIVEQHGGSIGLASGDDGTTVFSLSLGGSR